MEKLKQAVDFIRSKTDLTPEVGMILGSGLGDIAEEIQNPTIIPFEDIPGFPQAKIEGHKGRLFLGELSGKSVITMQGRFHFYEGYPMATVIFPVQVMKLLGAEKLIVTNAAGGVNKALHPGTLMLIEDHINFMGTNPLIGPNIPELGTRFPDMSFAYDAEYIQLAEKTAELLSINISKGVYFACTGPSYETPREIKMIRTLGGDAVGMSTVPEVIAANHMKMRVLGISCISNMAAGILAQPLDHQEVIETTQKIKKEFSALVKTVLEKM